MKAVVTTSDLAEELGVQPATVARWINGGRFPGAFQVRRRWRIPLKAAQRFVEDLAHNENVNEVERAELE